MKLKIFLWLIPISIGILMFFLGALVGFTIDFGASVDWSIIRVCLGAGALLVALTPLYISLYKHIHTMRISRKWVLTRAFQIDFLLKEYDPQEAFRTGFEVRTILHADARDALIEFAKECRDISSFSSREEDALQRMLTALYSFVSPALREPNEDLGKSSSKLRARIRSFFDVVGKDNPA